MLILGALCGGLAGAAIWWTAWQSCTRLHSSIFLLFYESLQNGDYEQLETDMEYYLYEVGVFKDD